MAAFLYASFPLNLGGSNSSGGSPMDLLSDTINAVPHDNYTPNQASHVLYATVVGSAAADPVALANKTWTVSSMTSTFDQTADLVWEDETFDSNALIIYDDTPSTPLDPLIMWDAYGSQSVTGADFTYIPSSSGLFSIGVAEDS